MKNIGLIFSILATFLSELAAAAPKSGEAPIPTTVVASIYQPLIIENNGGKVSGIYQEYLSSLITKAGFSPSFELMPRSRMAHQARKGVPDFFIGISGIPEAHEHYVEATSFHKIAVVLIGSDPQLDLATSKGPLVLGKVSDCFCPPFESANTKSIKVIEIKSNKLALELLSKKRISAFCTTKELFAYERLRTAYRKLKFFEIPKYRREFRISLFASKRLPQKKINSLQKAATTPEQKQLLETLYKKYGLSAETTIL